ncbi:MAG: ornithine cyclodeaminase family protein [Methanomicrobiales archaeon]|nr:ornithine cyclodeaminase family protein [Methanomicrobiales archaeon]
MKYYPASHTVLDVYEVNRAIEEIFAEHGRGKVQMPPKLYITLPTGDFRTMPAYVPGLHIAGVKIVNVHPQNREKHLPTVMALTVILDEDTGMPLAIINATTLTDMRTGGAGGVAAKYLAPTQSSTLGVVGSGRQALAQIAAITAECDVQEIRIWSKTPAHAEKLAALWKTHDAVGATLEKCCNCEIIVTTTPSRSPIIKDEWIHEGTHINAIGADAPGKEELDPQILLRSRVFVDDKDQAIHSGEINVPIRKGLFQAEDIAGTLGEVVLGRKKRESNDEITVFDSTGLAIQDLAMAHLVMERGEWQELSFPVHK